MVEASNGEDTHIIDMVAWRHRKKNGERRRIELSKDDNFVIVITRGKKKRKKRSEISQKQNVSHEIASPSKNKPVDDPSHDRLFAETIADQLNG